MDLNSIIEIEDEDAAHLWLATSAGLVLFNKNNGSYELFNIENGLSNNTIKAMIEDNYSNLWLSTNNGISRFNKITKKAKGYTVKDGVPPSSFFYHAKYKDEQGRIYFGSNNGYLMIDPKLTGKNKHEPPIVITELKILNQVTHPRLTDSPLKYHISETKEITLPYNKNSLTFEFTALNFNSSQNNKYSYYLEGFDNGWVSTNHRTATYTNLNPGKYIFRVKGSNNDNVWNEKGVSIIITITPPFYKTWWFNLFMLISLALIIYLVFSWRTRRITNKNLWLEEVVIQRTSELKEANEQLETFVYKASHDIKGPLRSIIGLTTVGKKDVKDEIAINYFDHILKSTIKLDTLLRDLLEVTKVKQATIKPEKINFKELVNEAVSRFENVPGYARFKFNVDIKEKTDFYSDKKLLYSIIQNLVENPIKYADLGKASNTLDIQIIVSEKGADLIFKDNGIGIHPDNQKRIFDMFFKVNESSNGTGLGLYIVKTTVEKLNGTISVDSVVGQGSTFYVKL
jgi:signal transduction histidine kinase